MSYRPDIKGGYGQRVFIWKADYSAGIASQGGVCAQGALTANAKSMEMTANLSNDIVQIAKASPNSLGEGDLAKVGIAANNNVMLTNATNGQTAFANIAFFYLCQITLNNNSRKFVHTEGHSGKTLQSDTDSLSGENIVQMWKDTLDRVSLISSDSAKTSETISNKYVNNQGLEGAAEPHDVEAPDKN